MKRTKLKFTTGEIMRYNTAIKHFIKEYERAKDLAYVRKPVSYALYKTWRWCDSYEKERKSTY